MNVFAHQIMLDYLLNIVKVLFHLLKVIEVRFGTNWVSNLWYKFLPYKTYVNFQDMGGNPGHGWISRIEENVYLKSIWSLIYNMWVKIYKISRNMYYITQLTHLAHIQPKKWRSIMLIGWNFTYYVEFHLGTIWSHG